ncbi:MAG: PadR family transcriptional regulator [Promethearchaeota archaeon]
MEDQQPDKTIVKLREWSREINRGFLEFWVLSLLRRESLYGARISDLMEDLTDGRIQLEPGTIYPLLRRLASSGWIVSDIRVRSGGRGPMRRYYRLTKEGKQLHSRMVEHYLGSFEELLKMMMADFSSVRERLIQLMKEIE